ncbi:putative AP2 protein [Hordeum vulgare]|nr:putative AP2 protein [Hordeum vulgare]
MPSRRRGASGYRGVRLRPNGGYYSEIRSGNLRLGLGTYGTAHEAARAYDAAAWRLGRPRGQVNFQDIYTLQQALDVTPRRLVITRHKTVRSTLRGSVASSSPRRTSGSWRSGVGATRGGAVGQASAEGIGECADGYRCSRREVVLHGKR